MTAPDCVLVIPDPPSGLEFGIDTKSYTTGPNFRGLSAIPDGLHFCYYSTGVGARQGFFVNAKRGDLLIRSWDTENEEILPRNMLNSAQTNALKTSVSLGQLNHQLGPYPYEQQHQWANLSNFITTDVLTRAGCATDVLLVPGEPEDMEADLSRLQGHRPSQLATLANSANTHTHTATTQAQFGDVPAAAAYIREQLLQYTKDEDISAAALATRLTEVHIDCSYSLEEYTRRHCGDSITGLLGELQLSFVLFLLLFSYPALKQWQRLVTLICNSEAALLGTSSRGPVTEVFDQSVPHTPIGAKRAETGVGAGSAGSVLAVIFIRVLHAQLSFVPEDFFTDSQLSSHTFLQPAITALFSALPTVPTPSEVEPTMETESESQTMATLLESRKRLLVFLRKRFGFFAADSGIGGGSPRVGQEEDGRRAKGSGRDTEGGHDLLMEYEYINADGKSSTALYSPNTMERMCLVDEELPAVRNVFGIDLHPYRRSASVSASSSTCGTKPLPLDIPFPTATAPDAMGTGGTGDTTGDRHGDGGMETESSYRFSGHLDSKRRELVTHAEDSLGTVSVIDVDAMSRTEQECAMFGWRYPLVYDEMCRHNCQMTDSGGRGKEDMAMCAARLLEEAESRVGVGEDRRDALANEAERFMKEGC